MINTPLNHRNSSSKVFENGTLFVQNNRKIVMKIANKTGGMIYKLYVIKNGSFIVHRSDARSEIPEDI